MIIRGEALKKQWEDVLKNYKESPLSVNEFTKERRLSKSSIYKWSNRLGIDLKKEPLSFIELAPISPQPSSSTSYSVEVKIKDRCSVKIEAPWIQVIELVKALV